MICLMPLIVMNYKNYGQFLYHLIPEKLQFKKQFAHFDKSYLINLPQEDYSYNDNEKIYQIAIGYFKIVGFNRNYHNSIPKNADYFGEIGCKEKFLKW